jgi:hypothetical protein
MSLTRVIPASEARRESFRKTKKDSGQAGFNCLPISSDLLFFIN